MQIKPVFEGKNVLPIVFAFNNDYSKYFSVALQSLIENSNDTYFYDIVVFSSDISERNKKLLEAMLPKNFSLRVFDVSECISNLLENIKLATKKYWSVEMYYRIIIPLVMQEYKKVLYVDSDIVFNNNIDKIFKIEFNEKEILAITDSFNIVSNLDISEARNQYIKEDLELDSNNTYFNSGVIVFNISAFDSQAYITRIKNAFAKIQKTYCPDQDILNYIFKNRVKIISQKWNFQYHLQIFHKKDLPFVNQDYLEEYNETSNKPYIIHYTSPVKPWTDPKFEFAEVFWKYARKNVFYEEILSAMYKSEIFESRYATNLYSLIQNNKNIMFWGASIFLENFIKKYEIEKKYYPNILGIIDKNSARTGNFIGEYEIYNPEILNNRQTGVIILTVINSLNERYEEVKNYLTQQNIDIKLIRL